MLIEILIIYFNKLLKYKGIILCFSFIRYDTQAVIHFFKFILNKIYIILFQKKIFFLIEFFIII